MAFVLYIKTYSILNMIKLINLEKLRNLNKEIYGNCSDVKMRQEELEDMLSAIDNLGLKYSNGRISKETFSADDAKLKKESLKIVKSINRAIASSLKQVESIDKEIAAQKIKKG
jgi:hypothetical protein